MITIGGAAFALYSFICALALFSLKQVPDKTLHVSHIATILTLIVSLLFIFLLMSDVYFYNQNLEDLSSYERALSDATELLDKSEKENISEIDPVFAYKVEEQFRIASNLYDRIQERSIELDKDVNLSRSGLIISALLFMTSLFTYLLSKTIMNEKDKLQDVDQTEATDESAV